MWRCILSGIDRDPSVKCFLIRLIYLKGGRTHRFYVLPSRFSVQVGEAPSFVPCGRVSNSCLSLLLVLISPFDIFLSSHTLFSPLSLFSLSALWVLPSTLPQHCSAYSHSRILTHFARIALHFLYPQTSLSQGASWLLLSELLLSALIFSLSAPSSVSSSYFFHLTMWAVSISIKILTRYSLSIHTRLYTSSNSSNNHPTSVRAL